MLLEFSSYKGAQILLRHQRPCPCLPTVSSSLSRPVFSSPAKAKPTSLHVNQRVLAGSTLVMAADTKDAVSKTEDSALSDHGELLQEFYKIPSIDKAWLFPSKSGKHLEAMVAMSEVNLVANSKRKYLSFMNIGKDPVGEASCSWSPFPFELAGVSLLLPSKSGQRLLVIKNGDSTAKNGSSTTKLELWSSAQLLKEIVVAASVHGSVYTDGWFEGVSWSDDESYIAYIAEEPVTDRPIFGKVPNSSDAKEKDLYTWQGQGDWQEDWGESYTGKRKPVLFVADLQNGCVQKVKGIPEDISVGQVIWAPCDSHLVFVGWSTNSENFRTNRKLGIKYCFNRPCALYAAEVSLKDRKDGDAAGIWKLTNFISSAFLPRFSPDGEFLVFLSAQAAVQSGVHNGTNSLHTIEWPKGASWNMHLTIREVVSILQPKGGFPGLYCQSLNANPWLLDKQTIVLSSPWCSTQVILAVDARSGEVYKISPDDSLSWSVLAIHDDHILAASSSFGKCHGLNLGVPRSPSGSHGGKKTWDWFDACNPCLQLPDKVDKILSSISYEVMSINASHREQLEDGAPQRYEAIFVASNLSEHDEVRGKRPLVVVVHGGPHSVYTTSFSKAYAFLAGMGLNLLLVNYRGSLGFGEEIVQSLPGKAGHQDVADVLQALDHVIAKGLADASRVAVLGGSHGGFLSTHLIGQAPDRFVTAAVVNPVCNISSMIGTSDIPDWCYVETYGTASCFDVYSDAPSPQDLEKFYRASPISHITKVKVPTLFLLGAQDRRVPISNGFQYVHALRARGLKAKVIVFPEDAHPIDRPQSEFESWLNIGSWFKHHLVV